MNTELQAFLLYRNKLASYAIFISFLYPILLIFIASILIMQMQTILFLRLLAIALLTIQVILILNKLNSEFKEYYDQKKINTKSAIEGTQRERLLNLITPIVKNKETRKPLDFIYAGKGRETGAYSSIRFSYIFLSRRILDLSDYTIQSVLAHEYVHLVANDYLKLIFISCVRILTLFCVASFTIVLLFRIPLLISIPICLINFALFRFFYKWAERILENTADIGTAILGFGPGLIHFFQLFEPIPSIKVWLTDSHESNKNRIKNIKNTINTLN